MNKKYFRSLLVLFYTFFFALLSSCLEPTVHTRVIYLDRKGESGTSKETGIYVLECNSYYDYFFDNYFFIPYVPEGSGYNTFNIEWKWESTEGTVAVAQMVSEDDMKMASPCIYHGLKGEWMTLSGDCLAGSKYIDWNKGGIETNSADSATRLRFYIQQDSTNNWNTTYGTVYIKKVWLSGGKKDDLVLFNATNDYYQLSIKTSVSTTEPTNDDVVITIYTSKTNISRIGYVYSGDGTAFSDIYSIMYNTSFIGAEKKGDGIYTINAAVNGCYWIAAQDTDGYWFYTTQSISNINKTTSRPKDAIRNWVPETTSNQWAVYNFEDLEKLAEIVNGGDNLAGVTITQKEDIIINNSVLGYEFIEPEEAAVGEPNASLRNFAGIGSKDHPFAGTYDGNYKIIKGLYVYGGQKGLGFIGATESATIRNVIILDGCVVNRNVEVRDVDSNVYEDEYTRHDGSDDDRFGGIIGFVTENEMTTVSNCLFVGTIGSQAARDRGGYYEYSGGIVGRTDSTVKLSNCYSLVRLYGRSQSAALIGKVYSSVIFTDCIGISLDGNVYKTNVAESIDLEEAKTEIINAAKSACGIDLTDYFVKAGL